MSTTPVPAPKSSGFFGKIGHFFKVIGKGVAHGFVALFGEQAAKDFEKAAAELLKGALGAIVVDAVQLVQTLSPTASDAAKRQQAFDAIKTDVAQQGMHVGDSLINMLIELAVNFLKGKITAAPAV